MVYQYKCDKCGLDAEYEHSMAEVTSKTHMCSKCGAELRRLITGGSGVIFKGDGWVDKEMRRSKENGKIRTAREQAKQLKEAGAVPWEEQIKIDKANDLYDRMGSEVRKKEIEKAASGNLEKQMGAAISSQ